jgi:hypothetical protein
MKTVSTFRAPLIEALESRQLLSTSAVPIHIDKAYKGSATVDGETLASSIIIDSYSAKTEHIDATVYVLTPKGAVDSEEVVGKLDGRRVNWTLTAYGIELKADFSTNGKAIAGVVIIGSHTGTFSLKLI